MAAWPPATFTTTSRSPVAAAETRMGRPAPRSRSPSPAPGPLPLKVAVARDRAGRPLLEQGRFYLAHDAERSNADTEVLFIGPRGVELGMFVPDEDEDDYYFLDLDWRGDFEWELTYDEDADTWSATDRDSSWQLVIDPSHSYPDDARVFFPGRAEELRGLHTLNV